MSNYIRRSFCTFLKSTRLQNDTGIKTYNDLPTLKSYPILGHTYLFLPGGKYKAEKLTEAVFDLSKSLGPIFKLKLNGSDIVITIDSDDTRKLFQNEGKYPLRPPFPALYHYRKKRFNSVGIVPGNGEEWYKFRNGITPLLKTSVVNAYFREHKDIAITFTNYIKENRNEQFIIEDLFQHLLKYTIEAISVTSPGHRFRCLEGHNSDTDDIMKASVDFMDGLYATLMGPPIWKIYKNKGYKKLESSHICIHRIIKDHILNLKSIFNTNPNQILLTQPFMHALFVNPNLTYSDIVMLATEVFLGGIDSTASTLGLTLHYLAHWRTIQDRARIHSALGDNSYLRCCLKETLRMSPTAGANSRFLTRDAVIGGHLVPKGILVSAFSSVTSTDEKYFKNPDKYEPERWLRTSVKSHHPFASLPFGHGPRMCPGRLLAFQEMELALREILQRFKLLPVGDSEIGMVYRMNRVPDRSINIKFVDI